MSNATVDIWQADALGTYSDTGPRALPARAATHQRRWRRHGQVDLPRWYPPRTNHVHVRVPVGGPTSAKYDGGHASHTGNLFFPEAVSTIVAKISPYTDNTASRTTLTNDFVSSGQNGSGSVLTLVPVDASKPESGSAASIVLGVDPSRTPSPIGISGIVT